MAGLALLELRATTLLELGSAIQEGFAVAALEHFAQYLNQPLQVILDLIGLSESTYYRRKKQGRTLSTHHSTKLYHLAYMTETAEHYFASVTEAHRWLIKLCLALDKRTPLQFVLLPSGPSMSSLY